MSEVLELLRKNLFMEKNVDDIAEEEADENMDLLEDTDIDENEDVDLLERPDEKMKEEPKYFPSDEDKLKVDPKAVLAEAMAMNAETIKLKQELQERIFKMESMSTISLKKAFPVAQIRAFCLRAHCWK